MHCEKDMKHLLAVARACQSRFRHHASGGGQEGWKGLLRGIKGAVAGMTLTLFKEYYRRYMFLEEFLPYQYVPAQAYSNSHQKLGFQTHNRRDTW